MDIIVAFIDLVILIFILVKIAEAAGEARRARQIQSILHDTALADYAERMDAMASQETNKGNAWRYRERAKTARELRLP